DSRTGEVRQRAQGENIILDQLWGRMFACTSSISPKENGWASYIQYGTGVGKPISTRNSLFEYSGGKSTEKNELTTAKVHDGIISVRYKIVLNTTEANNVILTEVGLANDASNTSLCTHAMLKDLNGNTISIFKTSTDIINIYATVFLHFASYKSGQICSIIVFPKFAFNPTYYTNEYWSFLWAFLGVYKLCYHNQLYFASNSFYSIDSGKNPKLTFNSVERTISFSPVRFNETEKCDFDIIGIFSSIGILFTFGFGGFQPFPVTNESIGTGNGLTKDFATAFGYAENVAVKVNATLQQSGINVDPPKPKTENALSQMWLIDVNGNRIFASSNAIRTTDSYENTCILYNPWHSLGMKEYTVNANPREVAVSDDLVSWSALPHSSGANVIDTIYRKYKYLKICGPQNNDVILSSVKLDLTNADTNIHFDAAPPKGAVITADYSTNSIPKDTNHVFDFSFTIQLGEYTPPVV
ncbi:MAG: hypothetical protein RR365_15310, partial [Bacteroides sp.]